MFRSLVVLSAVSITLLACGSEKDEPIHSEGLGISEVAVWDESAWKNVDEVTLPASTHPYRNNQRKRWTVSAPRCAEAVRITFSSIGLEQGYDFLLIKDASNTLIQRVTGTHDGFVSQAIRGTTVNLELTTDRTVTGFGFEAAAVQFIEGPVMCPAIAWQPCELGTVDVNGPPAVCSCPQRPSCESLDGFTAQLVTSGGFTGQSSGHQVDAAGNVFMVADVVATDAAARASAENVQSLARELIRGGFFELRGDLGTPRNVTSHFVATYRGTTRRLTWPVGPLPGEMARFQGAVDMFTKMVSCETEGGATCAEGFRCEAGQCIADASNTCANVRCGFDTVCEMIDGAPQCVPQPQQPLGCETVLCIAGTMCVLQEVQCIRAPCYPQPACVPQDQGCICTKEYAPVCGLNGQTYGNTCMAYCAGTHVASQGECAATGQEWEREDTSFGTPSPYANDMNLGWRVQGRPGVEGVRVHFASFDLEANYDFVVLYDAAWNEVVRYTGTLGDFTSEIVSGDTAYVVFTSDESIVRGGFDVDYVEYLHH